MAAIAITIQTTTAQIIDPNGRNGWGTVTIRPSQAFVYTSSAVVYTVTNASTVIGVADGIIATVDGSAATTFTLSPTTGNSNVPTEVYYIVDMDINGTQTRKYWVLDYQANTSVEWGSVALLPTADSGTDSAANDIINGTTNLPAYLLRSDTVDAATIGTASDGRGYVPRLDSITGKLPANEVATVSITDAAVTTAKILDANVTLAKMADLAEDRIIGRANSAGTGVPTALTSAQVGIILANSGLALWKAGADIVGTTGAVDTVTYNLQRVGNVVGNSTTPTSVNAAVKRTGTGVYSIYLPTALTLIENCVLNVIVKDTPITKMITAAGSGTIWTVRLCTATTGLETDTDFSFAILQVA